MSLSHVRYALNYKKLPYKTVWIKPHEIEPVAKGLGAKEWVRSFRRLVALAAEAK